MKTPKFIYRCSGCGHEEPKWLGRCPECGEWNTLAETAASPAVKGKGKAPGLPQSWPLASVGSSDGGRISSGIVELDRVLGGGIMKRSAVLVGGEPGIGKSTLLLQTAAAADIKGRILYISGEESAGQIRLRADRLGLSGNAPSKESSLSRESGRNNNFERIEVICTGNLEEIEMTLNAVKPALIMVDSAQTLFAPDAGSAPGTVSQMKYCAFELVSWVKEHDASLFLVAHVTKEGIIAGPKMLEHLVDTVLYFEQNDKTAGLSGGQDCRFLRASKNRFGSVDEIGIFTMGERGLIPVEDTGTLFLVRREGEIPAGVAAAAVLEGPRTILVEIQALTIPAKGAVSRVFSDKIDSGRVSRVAAALEKHLGLRLSDQDLYVNVAGGIRISEVGVELALAAALYSARTGIALPGKTAIAGELSLAVEVLPIRRLNIREKTAAGLGYTLFTADSLKNAVKGLFGGCSLTEARRKSLSRRHGAHRDHRGRMVIMNYIFIHGSGQQSSSWNETVSYMKAIKDIACPNLYKLLNGKKTDYNNLYASFVEYCNNSNDQINLCGLSLGGILALNYAIDFPNKIRSLILIGTPYKIPKIMFSIQNIIFKFLPNSMFNNTEFNKTDTFILGDSMKNLDFSKKLQNITCPTLVVCGKKDSVNIKSAYYLAENINNAKIKIFENTGHVINEEKPKELAFELEEYYRNIM
jgi:DNA repair protein RadA/Sms